MRQQIIKCLKRFYAAPFKKSAAPQAEATPIVVSDLSNIKEGYVISSLNCFAGKSDPVVRARSEYPDWVWQVLEEPKLREIANIQSDDPAILKKQQKYQRRCLIRANNAAQSKSKAKKEKKMLRAAKLSQQKLF